MVPKIENCNVFFFKSFSVNFLTLNLLDKFFIRTEILIYYMVISRIVVAIIVNIIITDTLGYHFASPSSGNQDLVTAI